jgi:hypothetical protein
MSPLDVVASLVLGGGEAPVFTQASPCTKRARSSGCQLAGVVSFAKKGQRGSGTCGEPGTK